MLDVLIDEGVSFCPTCLHYTQLSERWKVAYGKHITYLLTVYLRKWRRLSRLAREPAGSASEQIEAL